MNTTFRQIEKEGLWSQVPVPIVDTLRKSAAEQRRSISSVVTETLARGLGQDPRMYGIVANPTNTPSST